jgi:hypothetical protein
MLLYFILFGAIGLAIGKFVNDRKVALGIILGIAVLWGMGHRSIWGFVTLGELLLGYFLFDVFLRGKKGGDGGVN